MNEQEMREMETAISVGMRAHEQRHGVEPVRQMTEEGAANIARVARRQAMTRANRPTRSGVRHTCPICRVAVMDVDESVVRVEIVTCAYCGASGVVVQEDAGMPAVVAMVDRGD